MSDEFFREVDEDYRRDQIAEIWKKYSSVIIGVVALIIVGVGGYRYWEGAQLAKAREASTNFSQAINLAEAGKNTDAEQLLAGITRDGPAGYAMLSKFLKAGELSRRDKEAGIRDYTSLSTDTSIAQEWRDLAKLRASLLRLDGDTKTALSDLETLASSNGPWRHTSREMLGLVYLQRGDLQAARRWFDAIVGDSETPPSLSTRVQGYLAMASGGAVQVVQ